MKILHLTLKRKWFDMIASGEKKEEYREIKSYWINRLTWHEYHNNGEYLQTGSIKKSFFDVVRFQNGYAADAPVLFVECLGIEFGKGRQEWGAEPNIDYFVIKLGEVLLNSGQNPERSVATDAE